jgi:hypothetical protein
MSNELIVHTSVTKINASELFDNLTKLIRWANNRMHAKIDKDTEAIIVFDAKELARDLALPDFRGMTLQQVSQAFQNGLSNKYGDFYGLNCVTYTKWIRAFLNEQKVAGGVLEHQVVKARLAECNIPSDIERKELSEANLNRVIEKYKRTGIIDDNGNPAYLYLWNTGRIRFDDKEWEVLIAKATEYETKKLTRLRDRARDEIDKVRVIQLNRELNNLNPNIIKTAARNLAVENWVKKEINK